MNQQLEAASSKPHEVDHWKPPSGTSLTFDPLRLSFRRRIPVFRIFDLLSDWNPPSWKQSAISTSNSGRNASNSTPELPEVLPIHPL